MRGEVKSDEEAIRKLVARQFASLSWSDGVAPGWADFAADFHADARLFPSARPAKSIAVDAFVNRMRGLSETTLTSLKETVLGVEVRVFGNIAVAMAAGEMIENERETSRSVEMLLLVKEDGGWRIAAQAWDKASDANPLPDALVSGAASR